MLEGFPNDSFPVLYVALGGVKGQVKHSGSCGLLEEEASNDEDDPDD